MATYIQGLTQYLPQIQPFQRDFNFFANVMQKKQTEYDSGHQAMNKLYGSIFYSDISRADNQEKKAEILSAIDHDLRKVSGLDLSLNENVRQAQQVFRPFYEDQNLMKDISYTKTYQSSMQKGLSAKDCVGKDCPDVYWDGGLRLLEHQMKNFKSVSADKAMQMRNPTYVNKFNMMKEAAKAAKENNFEIVFEGPKNGYIVKEKNGPNAIAPLSDFLYQMFGDDARAIDYYGAKAQLSFYEKPEETINQYELQKMKSRAKDSEDYEDMVKQRNKQLNFEKNKTVINTAENSTRSDLREVKDRRKTFQDYADEMGEAFTASPAKQSYDETLQEEKVKQRTYENIKGLSDNVRDINYFDEEGNPVAEDVIVGVVAQGMMISDITNSAKVIANNTYQQTVKGADPYTMARYNNQLQMSLANYKNQLQKDLVLFKSDNELISSITGGKSKKGDIKLGDLELSKKEIAEIEKEAEANIKAVEGENISKNEITRAKTVAVQEAKAAKKEESRQFVNANFDKLKAAYDRGNMSDEQAVIVNKIITENNEDAQEFVPTKTAEPSITSYDATKVIDPVQQNPMTALSGKGTTIDKVTKDGIIEKHVMTYSQIDRVITEQLVQNAHNLYAVKESIQQSDNAIGRYIGNAVMETLAIGEKTKNSSKVSAANQILRSVGLEPTDYLKDTTKLQEDIDKIILQNPKAFNSYFLPLSIEEEQEIIDFRRDGSLYFNREGTDLKSSLKLKPYNKAAGFSSNVEGIVASAKNSYLTLHIAKTLGLSTDKITTLYNNKFFNELQNTNAVNYNERVKASIEAGANAEMEKHMQGADGDLYKIMKQADGAYLQDQYSTQEKILKVNNEVVQQTHPSNFGYQVRSFLKDQAKINYKDLKWMHKNTAPTVSTRGAGGKSYWVKATNLQKHISNQGIQDNILTLVNLQHLDKAGLLKTPGKWYDMKGGRNNVANVNIFDKDSNGEIIYINNKPKLTQEAIDNGIIYKPDGTLDTNNLLVSNFLQTNIFVPTADKRETQQLKLVESLQSVKDFTSSGIYKNTAASSDFGFAAYGLTAFTNLASANKDELNNLRDGIDLGITTLAMNKEGINMFPGAVASLERTVVEVYKNEVFATAASVKQQEDYLEVYKRLSSIEASTDLVKLGVLNAPTIKQTLIPITGVPGYGQVELSLIDQGSDYKKYNAISETQYNLLDSKEQAKIKAEQITIVPDIRIFIPIDKFEPFVKANQDMEFNTLKNGQIVGNIKALNAEVEIVNITSDQIEVTPKYLEYYRDPATNKIESRIKTTSTPLAYKKTASKSLFTLMNEIVIIQQKHSKDSWINANETKL